RALYEGMRLDAAGSGVRFTTVDPGMVETDFSRVRFRGDEARARAVYDGMDPLRPEDIADCILFAVTRPANVNIGEIVLWASAQASTTICERRST
ncbi:MAG: NAD(P)-dependent oxidoreductase, partial [Planctomycetota bacterium]